jgi:hypothetical protein
MLGQRKTEVLWPRMNRGRDEWLKHNKPIPHKQVLAELGITQEEIENCREPA